MRLVVGITGSSGVVYGIRLLEVLKQNGIETHLVISPAAGKTLVIETEHNLEYVESLASFNYRFQDVSAKISSGSFRTDGMAVIPCSMKTLSAIANGFEESLLVRAAMVTLKERRPLVLVPRETPLAIPHLRNMLYAAEAGAVMLPAMPSFYHQPKTIDDIVNHLVGKVLDSFGVEHSLYRRWEGAGKLLPSYGDT